METNSKTILQKLVKKETDSYAVAERYYFLLSAINDLKLTKREIELVAFTSIKGNISYSNNKEEFCKKHMSSFPTINNIISKLKKMGVLVKDGPKIKVNPIIVLNFDMDITLQINVIHG